MFGSVGEKDSVKKYYIHKRVGPIVLRFQDAFKAKRKHRFDSGKCLHVLVGKWTVREIQDTLRVIFTLAGDAMLFAE